MEKRQQAGTILLINGVGKSFEIGLSSRGFSSVNPLPQQKILRRLTGENLSANLASYCKKLLDGNTPEKIYVLTGPGSFTSTRLSILTAKVLGLCFGVEPTGCTLMECLKASGHGLGQVVLETGTALYFVHDLGTGVSSLRSLAQIHSDQTGFTNEWPTGAPNKFSQSENRCCTDSHAQPSEDTSPGAAHVSLVYGMQAQRGSRIISNVSSKDGDNMPDLLPGMLLACGDKLPGQDLGPLYSMQPSYLRTVSEVNEEQRRAFL